MIGQLTGCDSGFGHALAKYLDRLGFTVFAGVLNEQGPGSVELKRSGSERLSVLQLDVTDTVQIEQAYLEIKARTKETGCDSGFGHALAKYLDRLGFTVFAGVLNEQGPGSVELKRSGSERLSVLQLDVTDTVQIEQAYLEIKARTKETGLWGVVNNAGILGFIADGEILPMSLFKNCIAVNFFAAVELTQTFLPLLRQAKGRLVNISSMAGQVPIPRFAAYGASKAALSIFSAVMRLELSKWGVKVATVQPGAFKTSIYGTQEQWNYHQEQILSHLRPNVKEDYGEQYILTLQNNLPKMSSISSENLQPVLDDILHALIAPNPEHVYSPGRSAWVIPFIHSLLPVRLYDIIICTMFESHKHLPGGIQGKPREKHNRT
ncbi:UNVERIFIED_CONTAM: hypothetical protein FKN15_070680 [Acipenser sinensis]